MLPDERLRDSLDAFTTRVREAIEAQTEQLASDVTGAIEDARRSWQSELERAIAAERTNIDQHLSGQRAVLADLKDEATRGHADLVAQLEKLRRDQARVISRLLDAVRSLDAAQSLTAILEALARSALTDRGRVIVFVLNGDTLQGWGHYGFEPGHESLDVPVSAVKVVASAMATRQATVFPAAAADEDSGLPPFMRPAPGHTGLIAPLVVGGDVVAVIYADGPERRGDEAGGRWAEEVELLVRHARARLETVTSEHTVLALTRTA
jgi:hypothetical protein